MLSLEGLDMLIPTCSVHGAGASLRLRPLPLTRSEERASPRYFLHVSHLSRHITVRSDRDEDVGVTEMRLELTESHLLI